MVSIVIWRQFLNRVILQIFLLSSCPSSYFEHGTIYIFMLWEKLFQWSFHGLLDFPVFILFQILFKIYRSIPLTLSWRRFYHIKISPLICSVNQLTGFYMIRTSVMRDLNTETLKLWLSLYHSQIQKLFRKDLVLQIISNVKRYHFLHAQCFS